VHVQTTKTTTRQPRCLITSTAYCSLTVNARGTGTVEVGQAKARPTVGQAHVTTDRMSPTSDARLFSIHYSVTYFIVLIHCLCIFNFFTVYLCYFKMLVVWVHLCELTAQCRTTFTVFFIIGLVTSRSEIFDGRTALGLYLATGQSPRVHDEPNNAGQRACLSDVSVYSPVYSVNRKKT